MAKIKYVLTRTVLPSTIGAIVFIAFFFIEDRLATRPDVESCCDFYLSGSDYIMFMLIIAGLGSIFKFTTDQILIDKFKSPQQHIISILLITSFFLGFIAIAMVNGKFPDDILIEVTLALLVLSTLIQAISLMLTKFFIGTANVKS